MDRDPGIERKPTKLKQEGYANKFVDSLVDDLDFMCTFCTMVVKEARQISTCGHSFCGSCWEDWLSSHQPGADIHCPVDDEVVDPTQVFHDRKQDRVILGLRVFCDNEGRGCGVTPELRYLQEITFKPEVATPTPSTYMLQGAVELHVEVEVTAHVDKCEYSRVTCELSCGQVMYLRDVNRHLADDCPLRLITHMCGMLVQAKELQIHDEICPMKDVECEFCEAPGVARKDLANHHNTDCTSYPTFCNFALFGCKEKVKRSSLKEHHDTQTVEHIQLMNSALYNLYKQSGLLTSSLESPHELPYVLWGQVSGAMSESAATVSWDELARCGDEMTNLRKRSVFERVDHLEKSNICLIDNVAENKGSNEAMNRKNRNLTTVTAELAEKIEKMTEDNTELKRDIAKLTIANDDMVQKMEKLADTNAKTNQINSGLKRDNEKLTARILHNERNMDEKMRIMEEKNRKFQRGEIVEDAHYRFPCHWFVEVKRDMALIDSPQFCIGDGYKMFITAEWRQAKVQYIVGATFAKGENDNNLIWPWAGDDVMVVTDVDTGQVYESVVTDANSMGRSCPPGNTAKAANIVYYWTWCWIKCDKKPIKVKVVIKKGKQN